MRREDDDLPEWDTPGTPVNPTLPSPSEGIKTGKPMRSMLDHITNEKTKGMPHEASNYTCWCVESVSVLQQEVLDLKAQVEEAKVTLEQVRAITYPDIQTTLRVEQAISAGQAQEIERLKRIEAAAREYIDHTTDGFAAMVSYTIRLREALDERAPAEDQGLPRPT